MAVILKDLEKCLLPRASLQKSNVTEYPGSRATRCPTTCPGAGCHLPWIMVPLNSFHLESKVLFSGWLSQSYPKDAHASSTSRSYLPASSVRTNLDERKLKLGFPKIWKEASRKTNSTFFNLKSWNSRKSFWAQISLFNKCKPSIYCKFKKIYMIFNVKINSSVSRSATLFVYFDFNFYPPASKYLGTR